jgi:hypothetical protein
LIVVETLLSSIKTSRFGSSLGCCLWRALRAAGVWVVLLGGPMSVDAIISPRNDHERAPRAATERAYSANHLNNPRTVSNIHDPEVLACRAGLRYVAIHCLRFDVLSANLFGLRIIFCLAAHRLAVMRPTANTGDV